jgi:hypothetical protein
MVRLGVAFAILVLFAAACSSGDGDGGGATQTCENGSEDCPHYDCVCANGTGITLAVCINDKCGDQSVCDGACDSSGGLVSVKPTPTVKDTPECEAFCQKAASLGCSDDPHCDKWFYCDLDDDECPADKQAFLKCQVETGDWSCNGASGWSLSSSCPSPENCGDAGSGDSGS